MNEPKTLQIVEAKPQKARRSARHDARKFIEPVRRTIRKAFGNTGSSDQVADYFQATPGSVKDVVIAGHEEVIDDHGARIAAIERRMGMSKATSATGRLSLVRKMA